MNAISFENVWEKYRIKFIRAGKVSWEEFCALEDVSFTVKKGEVLGVVGQNGAGKTTLLKLIAGLILPDKGNVSVCGKVSMLMELGAGFNPEFTGRENISLNGRMYGLEEKELEERIVEIIGFAGLGNFIDAPVKYYSQGMYMRLAFALAIFVEPDILLIDDILAVGDEEAQQKCLKKIFELKNKGKTIILVSHNMDMVNKLCNKVVLIERGRVVHEGLPSKVIPYYLKTVGDKRSVAVLEKGKLKIVFNNGRMNIVYEDNLITKGAGIFVSFLLPTVNLWFSSFDLSWQIKSLDSGEIVSEGRNQDGLISLIWKIRLQDELLEWEVDIKDSTIKEPQVNLFLTPDYKEWESLEKKGEFPLFAHKLNWKEIDFGNYEDSSLGIKPGIEKDNPPFLVLNIKEKDCQFKLFNTGYEQEARVIQLSLFENNRSLAVIEFFSSADIFEKQMSFKKQKFLLKQQGEQDRIRTSRTVTKGPLRLYADEETKSLRLFYKDREVTKSSGLHVSFLYNKIWHNSSSCNWLIEKENDALILNLNWKQLRFESSLRFSFKDNDLIWQAKYSSTGSISPEQFKFGLFLTGEYKTFFYGGEENNFPEEFTVWQDIALKNCRPEFFGLREEKYLPAVFFMNERNFNCIIQNSDVTFSCRVLQLELPKEELKEENPQFSARLTLLEDKDTINSYLQEEQDRIRTSRTVTKGALRLYADEETKSLRLFYKDREITKGNGLYSGFYFLQSWFHPRDAKWRIEKISENILSLILNYDSVGVSQIWTLSLKDENSLGIKVEIEAERQMSFANQDIRLELQDYYKNWTTAYEQGDFLVEREINNIIPIRLKDNRVSWAALKPDSPESAPVLFFKASYRNDMQSLGIYKRKDKEESYICLNFLLIGARKQELICRDKKYIYFEGDILLNKEIKSDDDSASAGTMNLDKGNLKFIFDRGKARLFFGGKELTSGLGVYASMRSQGIWYDSYQAVWGVNYKDSKKITVSGDWPYIPVSQVWQIELINENRISWKVNMRVHEETILEIEQSNLMLSCEYRNWIAPSLAEGEFLNEYTQDYDILPFRFWYGSSGMLAAAGLNLPKVIFSQSGKNECVRSIVENTDYLYRARILQYQKANNRALMPGDYPYFEGVIELSHEEKV